MSKNLVKYNIEYIIVACCTYKRKVFLQNAINSLINMEFPAGIKTEILIVDNDKNKSARDVVEQFKEKSSVTIHYVSEENVGLSNVRNKALQAAIELGATHLAMIDDDEIVEKNWLINHINFYKTHENIYVSSGPAYAKFDKKYPKFIMRNSIFRQSSSKMQGQLRKSCATNNVFFGLDIIKENNIYFLADFNFTGGEDGNFFSRIAKKGYNIGWNEKAIVYEIITKKRANVGWILRRKYYDGYMGAILKFKNNNSNIIRRVIYIIEKILTVFANIILCVLSILTGPTCFVNCVSLTSKNLGKLLGAISLKSLYYYKDEEKNG